MTDKEKAFFESYNQVIEESYNKMFMDYSPDDLLKAKEKAVTQYLKEGLEQWERTPMKELDGQTPREFIQLYTDLSQITELFRQGAVLSDKDLPSVLTEKMRSFGEPAVEQLLEIAQQCVQKEDDLYVQLMAVRVLGEWKVEKAAGVLLDIMKGCSPEDELVMEGVFASFVTIGMPVVELLVRELDEAEEVSHYHEYILLALAEIGSCNKNDAIYRSLKNAFMRMNSKIIGASALATYGDGRAIPALRGYIERNKNTMDVETFYEVKIAVEKLGGSIDDIAVPRFRSNTQ